MKERGTLVLKDMVMGENKRRIMVYKILVVTVVRYIKI